MTPMPNVTPTPPPPPRLPPPSPPTSSHSAPTPPPIAVGPATGPADGASVGGGEGPFALRRAVPAAAVLAVMMGSGVAAAAGDWFLLGERGPPRTPLYFTL